MTINQRDHVVGLLDHEEWNLQTFSDLEVVVARFGFPDEGIPAGQVGTVVHVFRAPTEAYLVEFANMNGETIAMVTAESQQLTRQDLV